MKKFLCILCAVTLILCGFAVSAGAEDVQACGEWLYRPILDGKYAEVVGYTGAETDLVIPAEMDGLPVYAVDGSPPYDRNWDIERITSIVFPDSVRQIYRMCYGGPELREVTLPRDLLYLMYSFNDCPKLETVNMRCLKLQSRAVYDSFFWSVSPSARAKVYEGCYSVFSENMTERIAFQATRGDVNADNKIDSTDARLVLQYFVEAIGDDALDVAAADVNGDGAVDSIDARAMLQHFVGAESGFEDELIRFEPPFQIDLATVRATVSCYDFKGTLQGEPAPMSSADTKAIAREINDLAARGLSAHGQRSILSPYPHTAGYYIDLVWGEGGEAERVRIHVEMRVWQDAQTPTAFVKYAGLRLQNGGLKDEWSALAQTYLPVDFDSFDGGRA